MLRWQTVWGWGLQKVLKTSEWLENLWRNAQSRDKSYCRVIASLQTNWKLNTEQTIDIPHDVATTVTYIGRHSEQDSAEGNTDQTCTIYRPWDQATISRTPDSARGCAETSGFVTTDRKAMCGKGLAKVVEICRQAYVSMGAVAVVELRKDSDDSCGGSITWWLPAAGDVTVTVTYGLEISIS